MMQSRLRKDPQQARSRRTVDSILEAADRVLRTDGYLAASTNRLARVAGFSVGSLYQYFDDKESVVGELIDRTLAEEARVLAEHMETRAGRPLAEQVAALVEWAVQGRWVQSHLFESLSHHASELAGGDALPFTMHALDAPAILHQHLAPGLARVRPAGPLDEMVYVIAAVVNAASFHFAVHRPPAVSSAALVDHLTAALMTYAGNGTGDVLARPEHLCNLLGRWLPDRDDLPLDRPRHASRLQEARTALLRIPRPPEPLEPVVLVLAAVGEVAYDARNDRSGLDRKVLSDEIARMIAATFAASA